MQRGRIARSARWLRRYLDATSFSVQGEPLRPHCPASELMCSRTHASPALARRHLVGTRVSTRSTSSSASAAAPSPPEAAAAAPRRPMQQEAVLGPCSRAGARWWANVRASQRMQACGRSAERRAVAVQRRPLVMWAAASRRAEGGAWEGQWGSRAGPTVVLSAAPGQMWGSVSHARLKARRLLAVLDMEPLLQL